MQDLWVQKCLSTSEKNLEPSDALKNSIDIMNDDVFNFVSTTAQGYVRAAHAMLEQVSLGSPPVISKNATEWLEKVYKRLVDFAKYTVVKKGKTTDGVKEEDDTTELRGKAALKSNAEYVLKTKPDSPLLPEKLTTKDF
eukprot:30665-Amphidinium_carterae.1